MLFFWLFLLAGAAAAAGISLAGGGVGLAILGFVLGFGLALLLTLIVLRLLTRKTDLSKPDAVQNPIARRGCAITGEILCKLGGVRADLRGLEKLPKEGRFLFVCNHRSLFDPLMVMGYLADENIAFISKPSNMRIPLAGAIAQTAGFLGIDRENDRNALRTILTAADYLKRDLCSIGVYPEGTRSHTRAMLPFHKGSFKIAQRGGVPLVIAGISGSEKLKQGYFLHPHRVTLEILEVIPAAEVKAASTAELSERSRALIQAFLDREEARA